ncbi:MAG TPA: hypothetical protein ENG87_03220, partial [Candidatus Pacearchaeota archaeon]|nr:hypothetical protein [Candidatus Pacearchaeota archaeon]
MSKVLLTIMFVFFFISLTSAADYNSIQFNPGDLINITGVQCIDQNNTPCSTSTNCTITAINDSQDFIVNNITMNTLSNGFRNYNLGYSPNYTTEWSAVVSCENGGIEEFVIEIGEKISDWETAFMFGLIGLIFIYGFMGYLVFSKGYWLIKTILFMSSLLLSVVLINSAKIISVGADSDKIVGTGLTTIIVAVL